jgi:branched-chain amino acid transport system substrate-binding protein
MNKIYWVLGVLVLAAAAAYAAYQPAANETGPIKIGAIMILTGEGASWGEASRNGMALALEDINKNGGINGREVVGIYEDDGSQPQKAVAAFQKLTQSDNVQFIIGPNWSNTGIAVKDLAAQARVIMISPSLGVAEFNESSEYLFNTWPHDYILSEKLAEYVYGRGHRSVALLGAQQVWVDEQTAHFKERFEELGGKVALLSEPPLDTTDMRTEIAKIKTDKTIDAVVMTTDGYALTSITAQQLRALGVTLPMYSVTVDNQRVADCGASCEGMIFPTFLTPTAEFEQRYKATYDREVEIGADSAYDAVMMLAEAMRETGSTDPDTVKKYLAGITTYEGASGDLIADGKRNFVKEFVLKQVRNGVAVTIEE